MFLTESGILRNAYLEKRRIGNHIIPYSPFFVKNHHFSFGYKR